jgi:hypothetical protein
MKINEYRHSASKGNDWYGNPSLWIYRNLLGKRSETTPRMAMGNSAEFGCAINLFYNRSDADVVEHCTKHMVNQFDGEWFDETDKVGGIALNLIKGIKEAYPDIGVPHLFQSYKRHRLDTLDYPITTVTDFEWENLIIDTKATLAVPSQPREDHVRQQSLYSMLLGKPVTLVYASHKKFKVFELTDEMISQNYETMINSFESLEVFMANVPNTKTAMKMVPLNTDGYKWSEEDREYAKENWNN